MRHFLLLFLSIFVMGAAPQAEAKEKVVPVHGIAMHGAPKYKKGFRNFDYVNPKAPKGGVLRMAAFGSFDTFNPYVIKGTPAAGAGMLYDTLMVEAADEPFSEYGEEDRQTRICSSAPFFDCSVCVLIRFTVLLFYYTSKL